MRKQYAITPWIRKNLDRGPWGAATGPAAVLESGEVERRIEAARKSHPDEPEFFLIDWAVYGAITAEWRKKHGRSQTAPTQAVKDTGRAGIPPVIGRSQTAPTFNVTVQDGLPRWARIAFMAAVLILLSAIAARAQTTPVVRAACDTENFTAGRAGSLIVTTGGLLCSTVSGLSVDVELGTGLTVSFPSTLAIVVASTSATNPLPYGTVYLGTTSGGGVIGAVTISGTPTFTANAGTNLNTADVVTALSGMATEAKQDDIVTELQTVQSSFTGLSTSARQDTGNTSLDNIDVDATTLVTLTGQIRALSQAIATALTGTLDVSGSTITVQLDTAGLATSANQSTANGSLAALAGAVSGTEMQVDVVAALPAGSNIIGALVTDQSVTFGLVQVAGDLSINTSGLATEAKQDTGITALQAIQAAVEGTLAVSGSLTAEVSTTALEAVLTDNSQKTQIVDSGGNAVTVTGNKLDVNASVTLPSLLAVSGATSAGVVATTGPVLIGGVSTGNIIRSAKINTDGAFVVDDSGTARAVTAASLPLPSGAATEATLATLATASAQTTGNTSLSTLVTLDGQIRALLQAIATAGTNATWTLAANQSVNVAQIAGQTTATGAGTSTTAQRVVLSTPDPCSGGYEKQFYAGTTTVTRQLTSGVASTFIYICSINVGSVDTATDVAIVSGTGTNCGTATTPLFNGATAATGWQFQDGGGIAMGAGSGSIAKTRTAAHNVCVLVSAANTVPINFSYVRAP